MNITQMLCYNRINIPKGIDINKTSASKECDVCHYWYFLNKGFKFRSNVCNGCHHLSMMSMNFSDIAILNIRSADYHFIISENIKSEAVYLMQITDLTKKRGTL